MALGIFQNINIDQSFKADVKKLDDQSFLQWVKMVYEPFNFSKYSTLKDKVLVDFNLSYLDEINQLLVEEKKYEKHFLMALKYLLLSFQDKDKIFIGMDELTKYVYKYTKSMDQMITERLRQYKLLLETKQWLYK